MAQVPPRAVADECEELRCSGAAVSVAVGPLRQIAADWTLGQYIDRMLLELGPRFSPEDVYVAELLGAMRSTAARAWLTTGPPTVAARSSAKPARACSLAVVSVGVGQPAQQPARLQHLLRVLRRQRAEALGECPGLAVRHCGHRP